MSKPGLYEAIARTGQALANGSRLELLELLAQAPRAVQELAALAGLKVTTTSAHLQVLRQAGLVTSQHAGVQVIYQLAGNDVAELLTTLCRVADERRPDVETARRTRLANDDIRLLTRGELLAALDEGKATVLDVRPAEEYAKAHLPGAMSIPLDELADRLDEIPRDTEVITYCRGRYSTLSHEAARLLRAHGHTVAVPAEGILEWRASGRTT